MTDWAGPVHYHALNADADAYVAVATGATGCQARGSCTGTSRAEASRSTFAIARQASLAIVPGEGCGGSVWTQLHAKQSIKTELLLFPTAL